MSKFRVAVIPVSTFQQNCSLVFDEDNKRGVVVDPGANVDRIVEAITQLGLSIEMILLTHGHLDHAGGAEELREKLGVQIMGPHKDDQFFMDSLAARGIDFGMHDLRNVTPDRYLSDGDRVEAAGFVFEVVHAPGHSPGSVVFFNRANKFALMGDVLFKRSVGRTDLPGGSQEQLLRSIREKVLPLGDDVAFLPGHGEASLIGDERLHNPFLNGLD
jgi:hydroxyacylglutathione hydrolase